MFEYDIRNPLVHVPLSLTDTCQLLLSITERRQKDHIEYKAVGQEQCPEALKWATNGRFQIAQSGRISMAGIQTKADRMTGNYVPQ